MRRKKRHRAGRSDRGSLHRAAVAGDPGWHIDGQHRLRRGVDPVDQRRRIALEISGQPGAEQSVDDEISRREFDLIGRRDRTSPEGGRLRVVALRQRGRRQAAHDDVEAPLAQGCRRHIAVAAIVSGSAQHEHSASPISVQHGHSCIGHRFAGALHQGPERWRLPVGLAHLSDAEHLDRFGPPHVAAHHGRRPYFGYARAIRRHAAL